MDDSGGQKKLVLFADRNHHSTISTARQAEGDERPARQLGDVHRSLRTEVCQRRARRSTARADALTATPTSPTTITSA
nr:hypothetical protein GCM10020092_064630 [Actinoplanes digitatis]